jgi:hypothetical protein
MLIVQCVVLFVLSLYSESPRSPQSQWSTVGVQEVLEVPEYAVFPLILFQYSKTDLKKKEKKFQFFLRKYEFSPRLSGDEKRIGKWSEVPSLSTTAFHYDLSFVIAKSIIESDLLKVGINVLIV